MKTKMTVIAALLCALLLAGCSGKPSAVPAGFAEAEEHFDPDGFADYTDYCKYIYGEDGEKKISADGRFCAVTADDIENIAGYFGNFSDCMESFGRSAEYDFPADCISEGDYVYIITKEGQPIAGGAYGKFDNYTVSFYDKDSATLYYIHNNI